MAAEGILVPSIPKDPGLNENVFYRRHCSRYANNINALQLWSLKAFPAAVLKKETLGFQISANNRKPNRQIIAWTTNASFSQLLLFEKLKNV